MHDQEKKIIEEAFADFKDKNRWLTWKLTPDGRKPPMKGFKTNDPKTWLTFAKAGQVKGSHGVGITLANDCDLACIDCDSLLGHSASGPYPKTSDAVWLLEKFQSYAEISPSNQGFKIFARGLPSDLMRKIQCTLGDKPEGHRHAQQVELLAVRKSEGSGEDKGRYATVTGRHLPNTPTTINTIAEETWRELVAWIGRKQGEHKRTKKGNAGKAGATSTAKPRKGKKRTKPSEASEGPGEIAQRFMRKVVNEFASLRSGDHRNDSLFSTALRLGSVVQLGHLTEKQVTTELITACEQNGHTKKHGLGQTQQTISSGLTRDAEPDEEFLAMLEPKPRRSRSARASGSELTGKIIDPRPMEQAVAMVAEMFTDEQGRRLLQRFEGDFWRYDGRCWVLMTQEQMDGNIWTFLNDALVETDKGDVKRFISSKNKVADVFSARHGWSAGSDRWRL